MEPYAFISYSKQDKATADAVCHVLESQGIRCWVAPRDVQVGRFWKQSIVEAIRSSRAMVLIFSGEVNRSPQVQREVDIAFEAGRPILPFRIEAVDMSDELYYCLADRHWLDALTPPIEQHIGALARALRPLVVGDPAAPRPDPPEEDEVRSAPVPSEPVARSPDPRESAPPEPEPAAPAPAPVAGEPERARWLARRRVTLLAAGLGVGLALVAGWWLSTRWGLKETARRGASAFEAKKYSAALPLLLEAAKAGDAGAEALLGRMYGNGWGVDRDYAASKQWFELAAAQDHPTGYSGLGFLYLTGGGVPVDQKRGIALLTKASDRNEPRAQINLGMAFEHGTGVVQDYQEALRLYRLAAARGVPDAQLALGNLYYNGLGVEKSYEEAVKWYRAAADGQDADAQATLGNMYVNGFGVEESYPEAMKWYRAAAEQGNEVGEDGLGYLYWNGYGVDANFDESLRWYEKAAEQGDELAQSNIRKMQTGWVLEPILPGPWRAVTGAERRAEIDRLRSSGMLERAGATDVRRLRCLDVTFYEGATLYELEVGLAESGPGILAYIRRGDQTVRIDGKSTQIHELSANAPIRIETLQQGVAFLRFFMGALQADEGIFRVIDGEGDLHWLPSATPEQRKAQASRIKRLEVEISPSGGWQAHGTVGYGKGLSNVQLWLHPDGKVEMLDDKPLATDLPVAAERYNDQGVRIKVETASR